MDTQLLTGQPAPDFTLPDLQGRPHTLSQQRGRVVVLNFWSAECPWGERADRDILGYLPAWGERVVLWAIASNANETSPVITAAATERGLPLVLLDQDQQIADLYGAQATPHLFVIDPLGILRYQGAPNDLTFRQRTPTRAYLQEAVEAVLAGSQPDPDVTPAYGCTIVRKY